jgi:hypothetical protein
MSAERTIAVVSVKSSSLAAIGYDSSAKTLRVHFRNGGVYDYFDVDRMVYDGLIESQPHPWSSWGRHVVASYRYRRVA